MTGKNRFNFAAFKADYNRLAAFEALGFLYSSKKPPGIFMERFKSAGMGFEVDFRLKAYPVLAAEATVIMGQCPNVKIEKGEFKGYCEMAGNLEPDQTHHPALFALDQAIPRRSNRAFASDSLPRVTNLYQVYVEKLSNKQFNLTQ
jgi:hypothetical protein